MNTQLAGQPAEIAPPSAPTTLPRARTFPRWLSLAGGVVALVLAGAAEFMIGNREKTMLTLGLYLLAITLFAVSAWALPPAEADLPAEDIVDKPAANARKKVWAVLGGGLALSILVSAAGLWQVNQDLQSAWGLYLWLFSLVLILTTGIVSGRMFGWAPRWGHGVWPTSKRGVWLLVGVVVAILAVAAAARLIGLDRLPLGINADEGDRAAVSIQVVRGQNTSSIFETGWYWISMLYFWLLAQLMKVIGIGYAQARVFGALFSIASVGIVTWLGMRNFGVRVGLIAGGILSLLAVSLQFARETSEAGPTATLWALSVLFFLEAARTGKPWAWIGAGMAGGFAIYFYPSGRLWGVVAAIFGVYLLIHGLGGRRAEIFRGLVLAALASLMVMGPFLVHGLKDPHILTLRAEETSIFANNNTSRLNYVQPDWGLPQLLAAQVERGVGVFHEYADGGGFWPTDRPIMSGLLAMLTLLGLGWVSTRWRDPRCVLLTVWFWVGLSGLIVTVETPNVQRMATAVPVIALFPALVLDNLARRVEVLAGQRKERVRRFAAWGTSLASVAVVAFIMFGQYQFYFDWYSTVDRWFVPTLEGRAVREQGSDTLVVSVGRDSHMVNSGWVRLLAPNTPRGGMPDPGADLPIAVPADTNLAFILYPKQEAYIPYLQAMYPGGSLTGYSHDPEGLFYTVYRIPAEKWAAEQGAIVEAASNGTPVRVDQLGMAPPGWKEYPANMRWKAGLRVPQYWNYSFRIGPGPARLTIDGKEVLTLAAGQATGEVTVSLVRGDHLIEYQGVVEAADQPASFEWAAKPSDPNSTVEWRKPRTEELIRGMTAPRGLLNVTQIEGGERAEIRRIDNTLATCCFGDQVHSDGHPYNATWTGTVQAPATGTYSMTLLLMGTGELKVDGKTVIRSDAPSEQPLGGSVDMTQGPHQVELAARIESGPGGIEWTWTPPGGATSIVPPSVLAPPPGAGIGPELPADALGPQDRQPTDEPLQTVP